MNPYGFFLCVLGQRSFGKNISMPMRNEILCEGGEEGVETSNQQIGSQIVKSA